ncbi:hypothetical protein ACN47E_004073 [Coniothyrium glycines]
MLGLRIDTTLVRLVPICDHVTKQNKSFHAMVSRAGRLLRDLLAKDKALLSLAVFEGIDDFVEALSESLVNFAGRAQLFQDDDRSN